MVRTSHCVVRRPRFDSGSWHVFFISCSADQVNAAVDSVGRDNCPIVSVLKTRCRCSVWLISDASAYSEFFIDSEKWNVCQVWSIFSFLTLWFRKTLSPYRLVVSFGEILCWTHARAFCFLYFGNYFFQEKSFSPSRFFSRKKCPRLRVFSFRMASETWVRDSSTPCRTAAACLVLRLGVWVMFDGEWEKIIWAWIFLFFKNLNLIFSSFFSAKNLLEKRKSERRQIGKEMNCIDGNIFTASEKTLSLPRGKLGKRREIFRNIGDMSARAVRLCRKYEAAGQKIRSARKIFVALKVGSRCVEWGV